jgi:hypothetical protein
LLFRFIISPRIYNRIFAYSTPIPGIRFVPMRV